MLAKSNYQFSNAKWTVCHTFHINKFPALSRTSSPFPGLSNPGKYHSKIPGLSRFSRTRTNPVLYNSTNKFYLECDKQLATSYHCMSSNKKFHYERNSLCTTKSTSRTWHLKCSKYVQILELVIKARQHLRAMD